MRFMIMHKVTPELEAGAPPRPGLVQEMGALIGELAQQGRMLAGAGLRPSAERVRLTFDHGKRSVAHGPYAGRDELISGCAMIRTANMDQAIELATRIAAATGDRELEVGAITEPWHLGLMEKPANAPLQCLVLRKGEPGSTPPAGLATVLDELRREGALVMSVSLGPSATAKRGQFAGSKRTWTDGPFAESKELISGFAVLDLPDIETAQAFTARYIAIIGDNEIDIRTVTDVQVEPQPK